MEREKTIFKLEDMEYEETKTFHLPEESEVEIGNFMFRENIVSEIQIRKNKGTDNDCIFVKALMGNLILGVSLYYADIVLEIEKRKFHTDYYIRKAEKFDYPI